MGAQKGQNGRVWKVVTYTTFLLGSQTIRKSWCTIPPHTVQVSHIPAHGLLVFVCNLKYNYCSKKNDTLGFWDYWRTRWENLVEFHTHLVHPMHEVMLKYGFGIIIFSPHTVHITKQVKMWHFDETWNWTHWIREGKNTLCEQMYSFYTSST